MHLFSAISMYGTAEVFPESTEYIEGIRKGYSTNYYQPKDVSFFQKFGIVTNLPFLVLLMLVGIFFLLTYVFRNSVWWRKFKYFSMNYSKKFKFIPPSYTRAKKSMVIGEVSYNMADIQKYKEALSKFDMSKINEDAFKSSYSQLFQTSNGPVDTLSKLNLSSLPDKTVDTIGQKSHLGILPPLADPQKYQDHLREKELVIIKRATKDPKIQVVQDGKKFDRRKTFMKNWEFEDVNEASKDNKKDEPEPLDEEEDSRQ
mmetsp:Transcript_21324/g.18930  ORF Transcript_21324/g.18930 Transcript_21324/m.18930 type:complete len:258 (+) Transcript_21324:94-867(+)